MAAVPALAQPLRAQRVVGPSVGTAAAVAAALVPLLTAVGTIAARTDPEPGTAAERGLPAVVLLLCLSGLAAGPAAAWAVRGEHPRAAVGLAGATAAVAFPLWAGWAGSETGRVGKEGRTWGSPDH